MNALTLVFIALCVFALAYRYYGLFIANKVLNLQAERDTPAVTHWPMATTTLPPTSMCCSGTTLRPSLLQARCWDRCWQPSSATCPARCGSSSAAVIAGGGA
jgi:hypothetical protein